RTHAHEEDARQGGRPMTAAAIDLDRLLKLRLVVARFGEMDHQTSFRYPDNETGEEKFVGVPEQGGRDLISTDPLTPDTVYSAGVSSDGTVGPYRVEVSVSTGTGKLKLAGGVSGTMKESVSAPS